MADRDNDLVHREARNALLKYDRLLTPSAESARSAISPALLAAGLLDDARRMISSSDVDVREASLYLVSLLPPQTQAYLFSSLGSDLQAKIAFARLVDAERSLVTTPDRVERLHGRLREGTSEERLHSLDASETSVDERRQWETQLFEALDPESRQELVQLLLELERLRVGVHSPAAG